MSKTPDDAIIKQHIEAVEANDTTIEQIVQSYSTKIKDSRIFFKPNIPRNKLHIALNTYAKGIREKDVLVLLDNTVYGTSKDGALLTASALYVHNYFEHPKHIPLVDITKVTLVGNIKCSIHINDLKYLEASVPETDAMVGFTQMLQYISRYFHPEIFNSPLDDSTPALTKKESSTKTAGEANKLIISMLENGKDIVEITRELWTQGWTWQEVQRLMGEAEAISIGKEAPVEQTLLGDDEEAKKLRLLQEKRARVTERRFGNQKYEHEKSSFSNRWFLAAMSLFVPLGIVSFIIFVGQQHQSIIRWILSGVGGSLLFSTVAGLIYALFKEYIDKD